VSLVSKWVNKAGKWIEKQVGQEVARAVDKYGDGGNTETTAAIQSLAAQQAAAAAAKAEAARIQAAQTSTYMGLALAGAALYWVFGKKGGN